VNAFHITGLIHAFCHAVPANRGGSQSSAASAGLTITTPKPNPQCRIADAFAA
jgi:hypothetical protein